MIINPTWWRFQTFFSGAWCFRTSRGCSPNHQMKPWKRENGKCISFTSGKNGNCGLDKSLSLQSPTSSYPVISYHLSLWDVWCINVIASDVSHHQITNWRLFIPSKSTFPNNFSHVWQAWSSRHQIVIWICFWYNLSNSKVNEQKSFHNILPLWLSSFSWRSPRCACSCLVVVTMVPSGCGKSSNRYRYGNGNDGYESDDGCYGLYNLHIRVCLFAYFHFFCSKPTLCRGLRSAKSISLSRVLTVMMVVQ